MVSKRPEVAVFFHRRPRTHTSYTNFNCLLIGVYGRRASCIFRVQTSRPISLDLCTPPPPQVILWHVLHGTILTRCDFGKPVMAAQLHPRRSAEFIACPLETSPFYVKLKQTGDETYEEEVRRRKCRDGANAVVSVAQPPR